MFTADAVSGVAGTRSRRSQIELGIRASNITRIYEGTNQIQRMVIARQLLEGEG